MGGPEVLQWEKVDAGEPGPGQVKLIIDFRNPDIVGKFVYHCHILEHEDGGMMAVAEVVPPLSAAVKAVRGAYAKVVDTVRPGAKKPDGITASGTGASTRSMRPTRPRSRSSVRR